ncbi:MAG: AI-2E family transporter [Clostridia bacterium]|nr:AI-2E family transporter [Clostridia bacterium]
MSRKESVRRWLWYFSIPAATILLYKLSDNLGQAIGVVGTLIKILAPFVGGFILAFFLYGPSAWLENRLLKLKGKAWPKLARPLALTVVYLLLFGLLTLLVYLVIPVLTKSLTDLAGALPGYLTAAIEKVQEYAQPDSLLGQFGLADNLTELYQSMLDTVNRLLTTENILNAIKGVGNVASSLFDVVIAVIVSMYMLGGREHLFKAVRNFCGLFIKRRPLAVLRQYSRRTAAIFYSYFYGAFLDALIVGVVVSVGLLIFRVPYAVLLGMTLGLMNMIPYFGAIVGAIGIALVTLLTSNFYTAIGVVIYIIVIQQVDANIVQPRIVGGSVGLRPIYVLLSITLFGGLFGFWGIFLAPPLMALVQMLVRDAIAHRNKKQAEEAGETEE